ncbi:MAG: hypothetical protein HRT89_12410 [Lentisphaeria bacterium]|nr:hypothetical protein [Lentisphaeria bacterium]NQZ68859.1 hypothetical protein [Lentisphaeria bacterium]
MNSNMCINDLTIEDIKSGKNWIITDSNELVEFDNLEDVHISQNDTFSEVDTILYPAVFVTENEEVSPLVLIRQVNDLDYGGDYCEIHNGKWRQLGLEPNPNAPSGTEYIANPLSIDSSFDTMDNEKDDLRLYHREEFKKWSTKL